VAFLALSLPIQLLAARATRGGRLQRRDELLSLQGPFGLFAQLAAWTGLVAAGFTAVLRAVERQPVSWVGLRDAARESGSSLSTLGIVRPAHVAGEFVAFAEAGVGLVLLALAITYLPTIYGAFSRREGLVAKLAVRAGSPPTPTGLLRRSWELGRFERLEEVWNSWEEWFIDVGESHTSFPQLTFFRSPRPDTSWVTAATAVLDAAALVRHALDVTPDSRNQLSTWAGGSALELIGGFLGVLRPPRTRCVCRARCSSTRSTNLPRPACPSSRTANGRGAPSPTNGVATRPCCSLWLASLTPYPRRWLPAELFGTHRPPIVSPRGSQQPPEHP